MGGLNECISREGMSQNQLVLDILEKSENELRFSSVDFKAAVASFSQQNLKISESELWNVLRSNKLRQSDSNIDISVIQNWHLQKQKDSVYNFYKHFKDESSQNQSIIFNGQKLSVAFILLCQGDPQEKASFIFNIYQKQDKIDAESLKSFIEFALELQYYLLLYSEGSVMKDGSKLNVIKINTFAQKLQECELSKQFLGKVLGNSQTVDKEAFYSKMACQNEAAACRACSTNTWFFKNSKEDDQQELQWVNTRGLRNNMSKSLKAMEELSRRPQLNQSQMKSENFEVSEQIQAT